jgi:hypothetical protein
MIKLFTALALVVILAVPATASLQVGSKIKLDTSLPGGVGGQFGVVDAPGLNAPAFRFDYFVTFCVQIEERIAHNGIYTVTGISTKNTTGKTLGAQSAFLYSQFRKGLLGNFRGGSSDDANGLQYGIWEGMGYTHDQISSAIGRITALSYKGTWINKRTTWLLGSESDPDIGNVRVMQLGNNQDQLILVPEPAALLVWALSSIGFAGVYWTRVRWFA